MAKQKYDIPKDWKVEGDNQPNKKIKLNGLTLKIQEKFSKIKKNHVFLIFIGLILALILYYGLSSKGNPIAKWIIVIFVAFIILDLIKNRANINKYAENFAKSQKEGKKKKESIKFNPEFLNK